MLINCKMGVDAWYFFVGHLEFNSVMSLSVVSLCLCVAKVPFIAFYRKEYVEPELRITDLWIVYHWDEKVSGWLTSLLTGHIHRLRILDCLHF